jgi:hypothetical protein
VNNTGEGITSERLLKVVVQIKWTGSGKIAHVRELATIISNGGVSRVNLPAMGPVGGGIWDSAANGGGSGGTEDPGETPDDGSTGTGTGTGDGGTGAGGSDGSGAGSDNGNGNGNGNANGSENGNGNAGGHGRGNVGGTPGVK